MHRHKIFNCLHTHQFFLKLSKCLFCHDNIEYMGHIVMTSGFKFDPQKLDIMVNWPKPADIIKLCDFLSLTGYYHPFIKGYAF